MAPEDWNITECLHNAKTNSLLYIKHNCFYFHAATCFSHFQPSLIHQYSIANKVKNVLQIYTLCGIPQKGRVIACMSGSDVMYISCWNDEIGSIHMLRSFNLCHVSAIYLDIHHFIIHI